MHRELRRRFSVENRASFGAIAALLTAATACTLSQAGRDRCQSDGDCNAPRVCRAQTCVVPGTVGGGGVCEPTAEFGPPELVQGLNGSLTTNSARFSSDERIAYFSTLSAGHLNLFTTSRADRTAAFGPFAALAVPDGNDHTSPVVTDGGLTLYTDTRTSGGWGIHKAVRSSTMVEFSSLMPVTALNAADEGGSYIANDVFYLSSFRVGNYNLYASKIVNGEFQMMQTLSVNTGGLELAPVVSADGLVIYYSFGPGPIPATGAYGLDVMMAIRPSVDAPFGMPVPLGAINTAADDELPTWISPDGCRLYFVRNVQNAGNFIYVAERRP